MGDINADGRTDLLVNLARGTVRGPRYLVFGSDGSSVIDLSKPAGDHILVPAVAR